MALMNISLIITSVVAVFANNLQAFDLHDEVSLLQAAVETKSRSAKIAAPDDTSADDYSYAADVKCTSDEGVAPSLTTPTQLAPADTEATPADPPGAGSLRLVLQTMIVLIVLDGIRRTLQLRQEKASKPRTTRSSKPQQTPQDEAALESAWVDVVNAARTADEESFNKALTKQVPLMHVDAWGCTALHFAAVGGSTAIATELLKRGLQVDALDAGDETALHLAARAGHASMCELFIGAGANIDTVSKEGLTPLAAAGFANQDETCRLLTKSGAGVGGLSDAELPTVIVKLVVEQVMAA